ncbi:MAG: DNA-binding response OmpR family regulator [Myxococcota bacterium]
MVEDEPHLAAGLKLNFELEGFVVSVAATAREAASQLAQTQAFHLIVLDVMLPDMDGFTLCRRLRDAGNFTPVLMLTAMDGAAARVQGLEAGADDYLAKPFELAELLARVRSLLRRRQWEQAARETTADRRDTVLRFGRAAINFDTHDVTVDGESKRLTQLELELIRHLAGRAGRVVSREELLEHVWKLPSSSQTRTVDNFVMRLRRLFERDPSQPVHFVSVRGAGYRFEPLSEVAPGSDR